MNSLLDQMPLNGSTALLDIVRCEEHESRQVFAALMKDLAQRTGGRVVWGGGAQPFRGQSRVNRNEVSLLEFPTPEACLEATDLSLFGSHAAFY